MGECSLCDQTAVVVVNGAPACGDHVDDVMREAFRGVAIVKGINPDLVEKGTLKLTDKLREQLRSAREVTINPFKSEEDQ